LGGDGGETEILFDKLTAVLADFFALGFWEGHDSGHGVSEGVGIADGGEEAGLIGDEGFAGACCVGGDGWQG